VEIIKLVLGDFGANCYVLDESRRAIVIDPGGEPEKIAAFLRKKNIEELKIILTHCHVDHWAAAPTLKKLFKTEILMGIAAKKICRQSEINLAGLAGFEEFPEIDGWLNDGEELKFGGVPTGTFVVIFTPGHTADGISLFKKERDAGTLFTGDTLFSDSVGRTDLPTGSSVVLLKSIKERLLPFPDETRIFPGHGENSTIGNEKKNNPFIKNLWRDG